MRKYLIKLTRYIFKVIIGIPRIERFIINIARISNTDLLDLSYRNVGLMKHKSFDESGEKYVINKVLKTYTKINPVIFDVGSNIGSYTIELRKLFPDSSIYAFEPNPHSFNILQKRLLHLNIHNYNIGLSSEPQNFTIYYPEGNLDSEHTSIYKEALLNDLKYKDVSKKNIQGTTIDKFCKDNGIETIDFLKIDVEGHEFDVIKGAKNYIYDKRIKIIQFEFNSFNVYSRVFLRDYYDFLPNYNIYRLDTDKLHPLYKYDTKNEIFKYQNFLAILKEIDKQTQY